MSAETVIHPESERDFFEFPTYSGKACQNRTEKRTSRGSTAPMVAETQGRISENLPMVGDNCAAVGKPSQPPPTFTLKGKSNYEIFFTTQLRNLG